MRLDVGNINQIAENDKLTTATLMNLPGEDDDDDVDDGSG